jgi:hypothetical protein
MGEGRRKVAFSRLSEVRTLFVHVTPAHARLS